MLSGLGYGERHLRGLSKTPNCHDGLWCFHFDFLLEESIEPAAVITPFHFWAWVVQTDYSKTQETLCFLPFRLCSWSRETGYKRPERGLSDWPSIRGKSG